jgi:cation:H+ antiporter
MDSLTLILFILGFVLLIAGAEFLVRGASSLAIAVGISPLVVGLTVVAYGTSAPELAVTIGATFNGRSDIAMGNIVGSNISNILLVLGLAATFGGLVVKKQLVRQEIPLMILISILVFIMGLDGKIGTIDGIIFVVGAVTYTVYVISKSRQDTKRMHATHSEAEEQEQNRAKSVPQILIQLAFIAIGLIMLIFGADWLINGAVVIAKILGVSELVIGLTIIAVGTSLPEIATSVIASIKNQRDIAVGNAVGSNIFNILLVLGLTAILAPNGVAVAPSALRFDIPIMILAAGLALTTFFTGYRIDRWEGILFLVYYFSYTAYLYLSATNNPALGTYRNIMIFFVIPLSLLILIVSAVRAFRDPNNHDQQALNDT